MQNAGYVSLLGVPRGMLDVLRDMLGVLRGMLGVCYIYSEVC